MPLIQTVLFDLDGTLVDPAVGITHSIQQALSKLGQPVLPQADLLQYIGPPLRQSFATLLRTTDSTLVERAMTLYRERYATVGLLENDLYPGIPALLAQLHEQPLQLFLATAKPHVYARRILAHIGLESYFAGIYGSELDGRHENKGDLLAYLLATEQLDAAATVMVGDREHDIRAARQNGLRSIGVTYGYGSVEELQAAGADVLCERVAGVAAAINVINSTVPEFSSTS